jgi:hypothetical protein
MNRTRLSAALSRLIAIAAMPLALNVSLTSDAALPGQAAPPVQANAADHAGPPDRPAIEKATCGPNDKPETGLQGQIPMPERLAGFKGFSCNIEKISQSIFPTVFYRQFASIRDRAGHLCAFAGGIIDTGTVVVDITDPKNPQQTALITTLGLLNPGEGIRTNARRGLLASGFYNNAPNFSIAPVANGHGFDVYDVATDCRTPRLLATTTTLSFPTDSLLPPATGAWPNPDNAYGHEGAFAPDGLTYYLSDPAHGAYHAVDLSDPTQPKIIATYRHPFAQRGNGGPHGLSISNDGNRAYFMASAYNPVAPGSMVPQTGIWNDGFVIVDTSEVQARKPNAQMRMITQVSWRDGSASQMTIPIKIHNKSYLVTTSEGGTGQFNRTGLRSACAAGLTPFGMAKIYDINDEQNPTLVNKIVLEVNDPANCAAIDPEIATLNGFIYDVHMCSVDNRDDATTLACGYFQNGIRVYDIRNPKKIKEIAYYVPGAKAPATADFCGALVTLDASTGMLYSVCRDAGVLSLKFTNGVWPFPQSSTPPDRQQ